MTDRLLETGAAETARLIASGEVSPDEVLDFWVTRAGTDRMNSFLWRADAGQAAAAADRPATGPVAGVPVAVKDNICVEGAPTTAASRILDGYRPPYTATVARRLREAGLPLLGKTNLDEFAMGSSNETSAFGPVLNPWDPTRVPGGSSGGSAAAVAAGLAPWALGTDTGGSIRQPAAFCGLVGLKPTYGAVSRYGIIAFASSFDQCGPIARDVTDAALLFEVIQGRDRMDATSVGVAGGVGSPTAERLEGLRFGVPRNLIGDSVEAGVASRFEETLGRITGLGGEIVEVDLPHAGHAVAAFYILAPAEASTNLARFDGVRYGFRATGDDLLSMYEVTRDEGFGAEVKRRIMLGTYTLSSGYYDAWYSRAQRVRTRIIEDFNRAWDAADFIVTPTAPTVAFGLGEHLGDPLAMYQGDLFTVPMSLAGVPAISIPAGTAVPATGGPELPVGFQIAAPAFGERKLLDAAFALERATGFDPSPAWKTPGIGGAEGGAA